MSLVCWCLSTKRCSKMHLQYGQHQRGAAHPWHCRSSCTAASAVGRWAGSTDKQAWISSTTAAGHWVEEGRLQPPRRTIGSWLISSHSSTPREYLQWDGCVAFSDWNDGSREQRHMSYRNQTGGSAGERWTVHPLRLTCRLPGCTARPSAALALQSRAGV